MDRLEAAWMPAVAFPPFSEFLYRLGLVKRPTFTANANNRQAIMA
jgi:hypothetical protein